MVPSPLFGSMGLNTAEYSGLRDFNVDSRYYIERNNYTSRIYSISIMGREWCEPLSEKVGSDRRVPIPSKIREPITSDQVTPGIFWCLEKNSEYVVIANEPVPEPNFQTYNRTKILEEVVRRGDSEKTYYKIRPPSDLPDRVLRRFSKGKTIFYLAYQDVMKEDQDLRYAFLLSGAELKRFLPDDENEEDELIDSVLNAPSFLPKL